MKYLVISLLLFSTSVFAKPWVVTETKGSVIANPELMRYSIKFDDTYIALTREPTMFVTKAELATDTDHPIIGKVTQTGLKQPSKSQMLGLLTRLKHVINSTDDTEKVLRLISVLLKDKEESLNELATIHYIVSKQ